MSPNKNAVAEKAVVEPSKSARIFIGRLSRNVNKEHITEIFSTYGAIKSIDMQPDNIHPMIYRGFAYIEYENPEDANKAWKYMDGSQIDGQEVKVAMSVPAPPKAERDRRAERSGRDDRDNRDRDRKREVERDRARDRDRERDRDRASGRRNSPVRRRTPPRRERTPDRRGGGRAVSPRRRSRSPVKRSRSRSGKRSTNRRRRHSTSSSGSSSDSN